MEPPAPYKTRWLYLDDYADRSRWYDLYRHSLSRNPYAHPDFVESVAAAYSCPPRAAVALRPDNDEAVAGIPVFSRRRLAWNNGFVPVGVQYTPLLSRSPALPSDVHKRSTALDSLLNFLESEQDAARVAFQPDITDTRTLTWKGWQISPFYTYFVDLRTLHPEKWSSGKTWLYRKHQAEYSVRELSSDPGDVIPLCRQSYDRQKRAFPFNEKTLLTLVEALMARNLVRPFVAVNDATQQTEGGIFILQDGDYACYWLAGSIPGPAMTVLVGQVLHLLHSEGVHTFDFAGANTPGIAEFKRGFGSELVVYHRGEKILSPVLKLISFIRSRR